MRLQIISNCAIPKLTTHIRVVLVNSSNVGTLSTGKKYKFLALYTIKLDKARLINLFQLNNGLIKIQKT